MVEKTAYSQAVTTGMYDRSTGLLGKYDNVRRFWEDQITASFLRKALNELVDRKKKKLERIRILDLGCGSGDAYDLIMGITMKDPGIYEYITAAITPDILQEYVGVDINEDLLKQAEAYYGAQTQRAVNNFPISGLCMPRAFIRALDVKEIHGYDPEVGLQLFTEEALQQVQTSA